MSEPFHAYRETVRAFPDPVCVTWVNGLGPAEILRHLDGDPADISEATWDDVRGDAFGSPAPPTRNGRRSPPRHRPGPRWAVRPSISATTWLTCSRSTGGSS
ncbi:hypothetical protein [Bailinhaonella thermotolerans]|uniref:Uncharacterized protein n=1 Tax=Bailinhaonella thermotolerans TaxID=1070861 RepID=A0A3A4B1J4_9ACTN|nr:hypothetical protein [Bailinhaonella thermotolerans]RJL35605.1 hypothetical protein D5H75_02105 [Bailinhaonella thermotolerans]